MVDPETEAFDGVEDVVGGFRPPEGFRVLVVPPDEGADIRFELPCGGVDTPLQPFPRRFGEPTLDLVDPGGRGRREVDVPRLAGHAPTAVTYQVMCQREKGVLPEWFANHERRSIPMPQRTAMIDSLPDSTG